MMKGIVIDLNKEVKENGSFRKVVYTTKKSQLVLMSIAKGEEIGEEVHDLDQFIKVEEGDAEISIEEETFFAGRGFAAIIPVGVKHNVKNRGEKDLKIYTLYCPPEHRDGAHHQTREEAIEDETHFNGETTGNKAL